MPATSPEPLLSSLRDAFLLAGIERRIAGRSLDAQQRIRALYDAASLRASIASELLQAHQHGAAFSLLREAAKLYTAALAVEKGLSDGSAFGESPGLDQIDDLLGPAAASDFSEITSWLEHPDPLYFDQLEHDEALAKRAKVDRMLDTLRQRIEPRTLREVRRLRLYRLAMLAVVAAFAVSAGAWVALSPKNIALGKPSFASSRHPQSIAPPNGLTDGETSGAYGVHTQDEENAWVMVDLLFTQQIGKIKVFNRGDGYFDEGLPFALELSENGSDFVVVDERTKPFSRLRPWLHDARGQKARYVRIRKLGRGYVALSEIEIYRPR